MSEGNVTLNMYPVTEELKKIREYLYNGDNSRFLRKDLTEQLDEIQRILSHEFGKIDVLNQNFVNGFNQILAMNQQMAETLSKVVSILDYQVGQNENIIHRTELVQKEVERGTEVHANSFVLQIAGKLFTQLGLINSQKNRIDKQYIKSYGRISKVVQKFNALYGDLEESYKRDVTRIGKYILDIQKKFQTVVESRLKSNDFGFFQSTKKSMEGIGDIREISLGKNLNNAQQKVNGFIEQRKTYHQSVAEVKIDEVKFPGESISIPVTVTISKEEESRERAYIGTDVKQTTESSISFQLEDGDWFETYRNSPIQYEPSIKWRDMSEAEKEEILKEIESLAKEGWMNEEYKKAFQDALTQEPPRVPESAGELIIKDSSEKGVAHV